MPKEGKSGATTAAIFRLEVSSAKVIFSPTQEVFVAYFPLELESLILEEDAVTAKFSSIDTATVEPIMLWLNLPSGQH